VGVALRAFLVQDAARLLLAAPVRAEALCRGQPQDGDAADGGEVVQQVQRHADGIAPE
jgi:hypothetical protein